MEIYNFMEIWDFSHYFKLVYFYLLMWVFFSVTSATSLAPFFLKHPLKGTSLVCSIYTTTLVYSHTLNVHCGLFQKTIEHLNVKPRAIMTLLHWSEKSGALERKIAINSILFQNFVTETKNNWMISLETQQTLLKIPAYSIYHSYENLGVSVPQFLNMWDEDNRVNFIRLFKGFNSIIHQISNVLNVLYARTLWIVGV